MYFNHNYRSPKKLESFFFSFLFCLFPNILVSISKSSSTALFFFLIPNKSWRLGSSDCFEMGCFYFGGDYLPIFIYFTFVISYAWSYMLKLVFCVFWASFCFLSGPYRYLFGGSFVAYGFTYWLLFSFALSLRVIFIFGSISFAV